MFHVSLYYRFTVLDVYSGMQGLPYEWEFRNFNINGTLAVKSHFSVAGWRFAHNWNSVAYITSLNVLPSFNIMVVATGKTTRILRNHLSQMQSVQTNKFVKTETNSKHENYKSIRMS